MVICVDFVLTALVATLMTVRVLLSMEQEPSFVFGNSYGAFFGVPSQNDFHQNAAFQVVLSEKNDITIIDENDEKHIGRIVLVKPLMKSKIQCQGQVIHLYLSPRISFTLDLINLVGEEGIHTLDDSERLPFNTSASRDEIIGTLDKLDQVSIELLDPRLLAVLEYLNQNLENPSILSAAKRSGLSRSRIRTLARVEMGIPLSTWVTWRKLVEANKALSVGANLSEAALAGSFADQAHFTRTMKRMFGVTPTEAQRIYT